MNRPNPLMKKLSASGGKESSYFLVIAFLLLVPTLSVLSTRSHNIYFFSVWLLAMVVIVLPTLLLEFSLAKRSQATPLLGMQTLTREADASVRWRVLSWFGLCALVFIIGSVLQNTYMQGFDTTPSGFLHTLVMYSILFAAATVASFMPRISLVLGGFLLLVISIIQLSTTAPVAMTLDTTPLTIKDIVGAVTFALIASGIGLGMYWQTALVATSKTTVSRVMPLWFLQVLLGLFAIIMLSHNPITSGWEKNVVVLGRVLATGYLLSMTRSWLMARGLNIVMSIGVLYILALTGWLLQRQGLAAVNLLLTLVSLVGYTVFASWQMKSSHLRKAIGFSHESIYNLWRVNARILLPLLLGGFALFSAASIAAVLILHNMQP